ncbi:MAG: tRNA dihydrouridine synthase DusB [Candidatus Omnitrophica bacterium]|nr:tRNA dihydrouridine synthase DusB [Candidatus Omnitrophota bacterium]
MLKIGKLKLRHPFILAPMAGVTDLPFRLLNREFGCELAFIEMLNCRSLSYKSRRTQEMLSTSPKDKPLGVQLLGLEPKFILKGLEILNKHDFAVLDFNAACPAKKVVTRGEGSALLKDPKLLNKLLKVVVKNSKFPVTVKIRSGWDANSVNAREAALYAEDAGVEALFIHGRTRMQEYSGCVDYQVIKKVKDALKIPVIGSGDVFSGEAAKKMADETGCDAVAVARGALGNPWIFNEIKYCLKGKTPPPRPGIEEIEKVMTEHLKASIAFHGERIGVVAFRKFFSWYTKGWQNCRQLRKKACDAKTGEEMLQTIKLLDKHAVLL